MHQPSTAKTRIAIEGFAVHVAAQSVCGMLLVPRLEPLFPHVPTITLAIAASSAVAPLAAACYMLARARSLPAFDSPFRALGNAVLCMVMAWAAAHLSVFLIPEDPYTRAILSTPSPYRTITVFLVAIWIPFIEEILYRGYFLALLLPRLGAMRASLLSSVLFVIPHAIWGAPGPSLAFILLFSLIFSYAFLRGGLTLAMLTHVFVALYQVVSEM